jgi:hypothetical protein
MNLVFAPFVSLDDRRLSKDHDGVVRAVGFITGQTVTGQMPAGRSKSGFPDRGGKFPDPLIQFPVTRQKFPVPTRREFPSELIGSAAVFGIP